MRHLKLVLASFFLVAAFASNATLVLSGDIVNDTDTQLDWYTMTSTTNISWDDMQGNFVDASSDYFGFRYATASDLMTLWGNAGYTGDFYNQTADLASRAAVELLYDLFGHTGTNCCDRTDGRYDDGDGGEVGLAFLIPDYSTDQSLARLLVNNFSTSDQNWDDQADNDLGNWIIRESAASVPEPGVLVLLGIGMIGMGLTRRTKKA